MNLRLESTYLVSSRHGISIKQNTPGLIRAGVFFAVQLPPVGKKLLMRLNRPEFRSR